MKVRSLSFRCSLGTALTRQWYLPITYSWVREPAMIEKSITDYSRRGLVMMSATLQHRPGSFELLSSSVALLTSSARLDVAIS